MQIKRDLNLDSKYIRMTLMAVVVLLCILLIIGAFQNKETPTNIPEISNEPAKLDFLPMDDNTKIDFPVGKIVFPEDWSVNALLNTPTGTGYSCVGESCRLALVSPTVADHKLIEVVLSTPTYVRTESTPDLKKTTFVTNFAGEQVTINADMTVVENVTLNDAGEVAETTALEGYYYQLYGCHSKEICVYATYLSDNAAENALQVEEFKQLLARLTIE